MTKTKFIPLITCIFTLFALSACTGSGSNSQGGPWGQQNQTNEPTAPTQIDKPIRESSTNPNAPTKPSHKPTQTVNQDNFPPVNVAILLPLSGARANLGQSMLQGAQLALFDMGYSKFNLMPRDTKGTAQGASEAATQAINQGAQIILGPLFADSVRAIKPIAKAKNVKVVAFSTDWTLADNNTFLMGFMPFSQVDRVAKFALKKGFTNFGLIAPQDTYGNAVTGQFNEVVLRNGGAMTKSIRYTPGDAGVINQIESWKVASNTPADIQAVFMPVGGSATDMIGSALSYNNLTPSTVRRLGTGLWDDPRIANQPNIQGGWFAAPSPQMRRQFEQKYIANYGEKPVRLATLAYDATALSGVLAKNGYARQNSPDFSARALTNPNGFAGTDGIFRFKSNGIIERALSILEVRNGSFVEIDPAPRRF